VDTRTRNWLLAIVAAAIIFSAAMSMRDKSANEPVPAPAETTQQDNSGG
jgi:hypothetical protein